MSESRDFERFLEEDRRTLLRAVPYVLLGLSALLTLVGLILLRPTGEVRPDLAEIGINPETVAATIVEVTDTNCVGLGEDASITCVDVVYEIGQGPNSGDRATQQFVLHETTPQFRVGDEVVLDYQPAAPPGFEYSFLDRQRRSLLWIVAILFAVIVVALGRARGLAALAGLTASVVVILQFIVPAILDGRSPVLVAVVGSSVIAFVALYAAHGFTRMTTVALLGTLAALALTAILSWIVVGAARFSGYATEEAFILSFSGAIDISGLVLAGIVLGAVGAIDDVTVTQASAVFEIHRVRPDMPRRGLIASGLRIGRDHVASTVNTLLLAYAGASMTLLLFFVLANQSIGTVLNSEIVAIEAVRTLIGSIGLVSAVPLTTWLAAVLATEDGGGGHGHAHSTMG
jgi:uncharacterized membrane protein